jgi:hypothetical protein
VQRIQGQVGRGRDGQLAPQRRRGGAAVGTDAIVENGYRKGFIELVRAYRKITGDAVVVRDDVR